MNRVFYLYENETPYRIPLPTCPFEHQKFWIEPDAVIDQNEIELKASPSEQTLFSNETSLESIELPVTIEETASGKTLNETIQTITNIWQDLLGIEDICGESNFFDLGGNSVWASQMLLRISEKTGITLTLKELFENPTINGFAKL